MNWLTLLGQLLPVVSSLASNALASTSLSAYAQSAETAVKGAFTKAGVGVDTVAALVNAFEESHPLVQEAIATAKTLLGAVGINVPDEATVVSHIKAALTDLFAALPSVQSRAAAPSATP